MSKKGELQKDYQYLVGMTVVDKLGDLSGRQVVRINASDQVVLKDTSFGSNFPVSRFSYIPKSRKEKQYDAIGAFSVDYADEFDTNQPTPQVGDVYESKHAHATLLRPSGWPPGSWVASVPLCDGERIIDPLAPGWTLIERDGKPWPPAQEPDPWDPGTRWDMTRDIPQIHQADVEPATDDQIASLERMLSDPDARPRDGSGISWHSARALLARVRQEQATLRAARRERDHEQREREWAQRNYAQAEGREKAATYDRGKALQRTAEAERERDEAVARAEQAEAQIDAARKVLAAAPDTGQLSHYGPVGEGECAVERFAQEVWEALDSDERGLARVERVTAAERAVVEAAKRFEYEHSFEEGESRGCSLICQPVQALLRAERAGS